MDPGKKRVFSLLLHNNGLLGEKLHLEREEGRKLRKRFLACFPSDFHVGFFLVRVGKVQFSEFNPLVQLSII